MYFPSRLTPLANAGTDSKSGKEFFAKQNICYPQSVTLFALKRLQIGNRQAEACIPVVTIEVNDDSRNVSRHNQ
jgi:hypothetical protein